MLTNSVRRFYKNIATGEITESYKEAISWFEMNGDGVEFYKNGHIVFVLDK